MQRLTDAPLEVPHPVGSSGSTEVREIRTKAHLQIDTLYACRVAQALTDCGLDLEKVRAEVDRRVGGGPEEPKGHMPFTPRAKKVLELSLRQALKLSHNYIGTEHILLGLVAEGEGVAAQILMADVEGGLVRVREAVFARMGRPAESLVGVEGRLAEIGRVVRERFPRVALGTEDETRKRLEAIEARLSVIEQLLRRQLGEEEVS